MRPACSTAWSLPAEIAAAAPHPGRHTHAAGTPLAVSPPIVSHQGWAVVRSLRTRPETRCGTN